MALYTGIDGVLKKANSIKEGVSGVLKTISSGKVGISGVMREYWAPIDIDGIEIYVDSIWLYTQNSSTLNDTTIDSTSANLNNIYNYGNVIFNETRIQTTSNKPMKGICINGFIYYIKNGVRYPFISLANTTNFTFPVSWSNPSSAATWKYILGVGYTGSSGTQYIYQNTLTGYDFQAGVIDIRNSTSSYTQTLSFNNVTVNGKSITPKIVSLPSGWSFPITVDAIEIEITRIYRYTLDSSGNEGSTTTLNYNTSHSHLFLKLNKDKNAIILRSNSTGTGIAYDAIVYYKIGNTRYSFHNLNLCSVPYSFPISINSTYTFINTSNYSILKSSSILGDTNALSISGTTNKTLNNTSNMAKTDKCSTGIGIYPSASANGEFNVIQTSTFNSVNINGKSIIPTIVKLPSGWPIDPITPDSIEIELSDIYYQEAETTDWENTNYLGNVLTSSNSSKYGYLNIYNNYVEIYTLSNNIRKGVQVYFNVYYKIGSSRSSIYSIIHSNTEFTFPTSISYSGSSFRYWYYTLGFFNYINSVTSHSVTHLNAVSDNTQVGIINASSGSSYIRMNFSNITINGKTFTPTIIPPSGWSMAVTVDAIEIDITNISYVNGSSTGTTSSASTLKSSYGATFNISNNVIILRSKTIGKGVAFTFKVYYKIGSTRYEFHNLNCCSTNYSFPVTFNTTYTGSGITFEASPVRILSTDDADNITLATSGNTSKTVSRPYASSNECTSRLKLTAGTGTTTDVTQRITFGSISAGGKSFTPVITSLPSGWSMPITPDSVEIGISSIRKFNSTESGNTYGYSDITSSNVSTYGSVSISRNQIIIQSNNIGTGIVCYMNIYYKIGSTSYTFNNIINGTSDWLFPVTFYRTYSGSGDQTSIATVLGYNYYDVPTSGSITKNMGPLYDSGSSNRCECGIAKCNGSGYAQQRITFSNITINGKSFTPRITSVPSGWTVPT